VEPALSQLTLPPGQSLTAWNDAYLKVESYLNALRLKNRLLIGKTVFSVLGRALQRVEHEADRRPTELAMEEAVKLVNGWVGDVLDQDVADQPHRIATQGRLAMLLADVPGRWQELFLAPGPWPAEFVQSMRESYLRAGPDFQIAQMTPRPIDLGAITTLTTLGRRKYSLMIVIWILFLLGMVWVFQRLH
jgi:hypothetical protein